MWHYLNFDSESDLEMMSSVSDSASDLAIAAGFDYIPTGEQLSLNEVSGFWTSVINARIPDVETSISATGSGISSETRTLPRALNSYDAEITDVLHVLQILRSKRNAHTLPCRLPSELLARCFWFLAQSDPPFLQRAMGGTATRGWLDVLRVCSHFRQVALAEPRLWNKIELANIEPPWTARMVKLAKKVPLVIHATRDTLPVHRLKVLHDYIAQIQEIVLHQDPKHTIKILDRLYKPAPLLEKLVVKTPFSGYLHGHIKYLPSRLFNLVAPRLRDVVLLDFMIPRLAFPLLQAVVTLEIEFSTSTTWDSHVDHQGMSLVDFCEMLRVASHLRSLILVRSLPVAPAIRSNDDDSHAIAVTDTPFRVNLSHLKQLSLHGTMAQCLQLLRCLDFPLSAQLHIVCSAEVSDEGNIVNYNKRLLFSTISTRTSHEDYPRIQRLLIDPCGMNDTNMEIIALSTSDTSSKWEEEHYRAFENNLHLIISDATKFSLRTEDHFLSRRASSIDIASFMPPRFDLSDLRFLTLGTQMVDLPGLIQSLEQAQRLEHLAVRGPSQRQLCAALDVPVQAQTEMHEATGHELVGLGRDESIQHLDRATICNQQVLCPRLKTLSFHSGDASQKPSRRYGYLVGDDVWNTPEPFYLELKRMLERRKDFGIPISWLGFIKSAVGRTQVSELEEVVETVYVETVYEDGRSQDSSSDSSGEDYHSYEDSFSDEDGW